MILVVLYIVIVPISWREQKLLTGWMEKLNKEKANKLFVFSFLSLSVDAITVSHALVFAHICLCLCLIVHMSELDNDKHVTKFLQVIAFLN